jgi:hypothetical protein
VNPSRRGGTHRHRGGDAQVLPSDGEVLGELLKPLAGLAGFGAAATAAVPSLNGSDDSGETWSGVKGELAMKGYRTALPGLAEQFYDGSPYGGQGEVGLESWERFRVGAGGVPGRVPDDPSATRRFVGPDFDKNSLDDHYALENKLRKPGRDGLPDETRLARPDWDAFARRESIPRRNRGLDPYSFTFDSPRARFPGNFGVGPDLGGFSRRATSGPGKNVVRVLTVTPDVNSHRFAHKFLPQVVEDVYRSAMDEPDVAAALSGAASRGRHTLGHESISLPSVTPHSEGTGGSKRSLPELRGWQGKTLPEKVALMDQMSPGQSLGEGVSATLWGTLDSTPRYEYAEIRRGSIRGQNPEVHIIDVKTPPTDEIRYSLTGEMRTPYVRRNNDILFDVGPHWGATEINPNTGTGRRSKKDVSGDIHFNAGLIERRGALSLADLQALQKHYGIPMTRGPGERGEGFRKGVEALRVKLGLGSDAEVIERFARNVPTLGRTTAPRKPVQFETISLSAEPDWAQGPGTGSFRRAYDLPAALERAGHPSTLGGVRALNRQVQQSASRELSGVKRMAGMAPAVGFAGGAFLDPEAAKLFGQGVAQGGNEGFRKAYQGMGTMAVNSGIGAATGLTVGQGMRTLARQAPALAAKVLPRVAQGSTALTPYGLALTAFQTADAFVEGSSGRPIARHAGDAFRGSPAGQALRTAVGGRQVKEILPELFPSRSYYGTGRTAVVTGGKPKPVTNRPVRGTVPPPKPGPNIGNEAMYIWNQLGRGKLPYSR